MTEEQFNELYPIGTKVKYYPIISRPEVVETETRSEAWTLDSGDVIVKVKGRTGGVSLMALEIVSQ